MDMQSMKRAVRAIERGQRPAAEALGISADDGERLAAFGAALFGEEDYVGARDAALLATSAAAGSVPAWLLLGAAEAALQRFDAAVRAYQRATELDSKCIQAWVDLAEAQIARLDFTAAAAALKRAIALDPKPDTPQGLRAQMLVADTMSRFEGDNP
jgi:tetratricopeptide (TPR) repeat protein